jgi:hypothetical protein
MGRGSQQGGRPGEGGGQSEGQPEADSGSLKRSRSGSDIERRDIDHGDEEDANDHHGNECLGCGVE